MTDSIRRRTRVQTGRPGFLLFGTTRLAMHTRNLSLKGVLCDVGPHPAGAIPHDHPCLVELPLSAEVRVEVEGLITRVETIRGGGTMVAVDFTGMEPESYGHLRNLVRFSAPDADAIDQEELLTPFTE